MNEKEACKRWLAEGFSYIPVELIGKAYEYYEGVEILSKVEADDFMPMWGTLFCPKQSIDQDWIRENIEIVEKCGLMVFETDTTGILLGIDGAGYDFFEDHWMPLYRERGLQWHDKESK